MTGIPAPRGGSARRGVPIGGPTPVAFTTFGLPLSRSVDLLSPHQGWTSARHASGAAPSFLKTPTREDV